MSRRVHDVPGFLRLALPMVVSRAGIAGMSIADAVMVARHSGAELALLGLAEGTLGRLLDVLVALVGAGMVLAAGAVAAASGNAEKSEAGMAEAAAIWRRALLYSVIIGLVAAVVGGAGRWWLSLLGEPAALVAGAGPVAAVLAASIPAALIAIATAMFLEAVGRAGTVAIAVVSANLLNILLNCLLIGGGHGIPPFGALGSVISTGMVRLALAIALACYAWRLPLPMPSGVAQAGAWARHWRDGAAQRRLGYGAAATAAVMNVLIMSLTVFAGWLGALPLAAMTALWSLLSVGMLLALGMADATALRVAAVDRGRRDGAAFVAGGLGLAVTLATLALLAVAVLLAPGALAGVYAAPGGLRSALVALLPLGALVMLCDGASFVGGAALRGVGDVVWPTCVQIAVAAALVPLAWWLAISRGGGAPGLVEAILLTSLVRAVLLALRFRSLTRPPQPHFATLQT